MASYVTLDELKARLDFDIEPHEESMANSALEDLSDDTRFYGKDWPLESVPPIVKRLILKAAMRFMRNPDGYEMSRAGDATVQWHEGLFPEGGVSSFTEAEQKLIHELVHGKSTLRSATVFAFNSRPVQREGFVPIQDGSMFPFFSSDTSPW